MNNKEPTTETNQGVKQEEAECAERDSEPTSTRPLRSTSGIMRYGETDSEKSIKITPSAVVTFAVFFGSIVHTLNLLF